MIRISRARLDACINAFRMAAEEITDVNGNPLEFPLDDVMLEKVVLACLTIAGPYVGPVTPDDMFYVSGLGTGKVQQFPPDSRRV